MQLASGECARDEPTPRLHSRTLLLPQSGIETRHNDSMRQWLSRGFAFAGGACFVWALWVVLVVANLWLGDGTLICEHFDESDCGGPANDLFGLTEPITDIAIPATCLGGGALLAAKTWNRCWKLLLPPGSGGSKYPLT